MKSNTAFALWPIVPFGGEDDKTNTDAGNGGADGANGGNGNPQGSQGNSGKGGEGSADGKGKADTSNNDDDDDDADEFKGLTIAEVRRIAADNAKKAKDAEKETKKFKDAQDAEERKKNDDVTNLTKDLATERDTVATLRTTVTKQAIIGAIRDDSRYEWHDPEMVAQQLDPEVVKVDDQGRVEGIKASLPKIAKAHAFLLKKDNTVDNNDGKGGTKNGGTQQNNGNNGSTGSQPGQGGTSGGGGNEPDITALADNYPALAARI